MHPNDGRVVSNFIVQSLAGESITIHGDGSQTRSFCFVDDLIDGFIRFMNTSDDITGPINLGNPDEFTIRELAELVLDQVGRESELVEKALPADDPQQRKPDIGVARETLNWEPKVKLAQGLERTVAYFEEECAS